MALAKSVNKLLLAASASKARLIVVVTWYLMFTFGLIYVCSSALKWPNEGHYSSWTQINARGPKWDHYSSHVLGHY